MESHPPAAVIWTSSPLDEYLVSMEVCEAGMDEGKRKVETFFAVGEMVDPFRIHPQPAPLPPSSWAATAWGLARSFLFSGRRFEAGPLLRPLELEPLSRRFSNV